MRPYLYFAFVASVLGGCAAPSPRSATPCEARCLETRQMEAQPIERVTSSCADECAADPKRYSAER